VRRNLKAFDEDYLKSLQDKGGPLPDQIISRLTKLIFDESNKAEGKIDYYLSSNYNNRIHLLFHKSFSCIFLETLAFQYYWHGVL
jgi:hypothetical protein